MDIKDLGGISEPAKALIEKCSDALGAVAHPYQIVRVANADAKASVIKARADVEVAKIKAEGDIEILAVEERALQRLVYEEGKKQQNIESIVAKALPQVSESAAPQQIDEDWLSNFFDKCRLISDEEMQCLWAQILANEANTQSSFSKKTVNTLQSLEKQDALAFQTLCRFCVDIDGKKFPIINNLNDEIYTENDFSMEKLNDLQSLGLVVTSGWSFAVPVKTDHAIVRYHSDAMKVVPRTEDPSIGIGRAMLTTIGEELFNVFEVIPVDGLGDYLANEAWGKYYEVKVSK